MRKDRKNRILAFVLAAIMIVGMFPASAFAENQETGVQQISEEKNTPDSNHEEENTTTGDQTESQNPSEEQPKKTRVIKRKVWRVMIIDGEEVMVEEEIEEEVEVDDEDELGEEQEEQKDEKKEESQSESSENQQKGVTNETTTPVSDEDSSQNEETDKIVFTGEAGSDNNTIIVTTGSSDPIEENPTSSGSDQQNSGAGSDQDGETGKIIFSGEAGSSSTTSGDGNAENTGDQEKTVVVTLYPEEKSEENHPETGTGESGNEENGNSDEESDGKEADKQQEAGDEKPAVVFLYPEEKENGQENSNNEENKMSDEDELKKENEEDNKPGEEKPETGENMIDEPDGEETGEKKSKDDEEKEDAAEDGEDKEGSKDDKEKEDTVEGGENKEESKDDEEKEDTVEGGENKEESKDDEEKEDAAEGGEDKEESKDNEEKEDTVEGSENKEESKDDEEKEDAAEDGEDKEESKDGEEEEDETKKRGQESPEEEETEEDPIKALDGGVFYIYAASPAYAGSVYYYTDQLISASGVQMIRKTARNDIGKAARYRFEAEDGEPVSFRICCLDAGYAYIVRTGGNNLGFTTDKAAATLFTVEITEDGYFFTENGYHLNMKGKDSGKGFQASTASDSVMNLMPVTEVNIRYRYIAFSDEIGTADPLPEDEVDTASVNELYTVRTSALMNYQSEAANFCYTYSFDHWTDESGAMLAPGDALDLSAVLPGSTVILSTVWTLTETTERPVTVQYVVKTPAAISGTNEASPLPGVAGTNLEKLTGIWAQNYQVQDLTEHYYKRIKRAGVTTHFPYFIYQFDGWQAEDGSIVWPFAETDETVDLRAVDADGQPVYDRNGDGKAEFTARWRYLYDSGTGYPSANFTIWREISSADSMIDSQTMLDEQTARYTPSVGVAIMYAYDSDGNEVWVSPAKNGTGAPNVGDYYTTGGGKNQPAAGKYMMFSYVGSTILEADQNTRQLAETGYATADSDAGSVTWKLSYLPSDEEVLSRLREFAAAGMTTLYDEKGEVIPEEELTTDNFVVRWCHVKYQSGSQDGWNINAKLTRRMSYVQITKTFYGDSAAIAAAIAGGFNITLTDPDGREITLSMTDRTGGSLEDGMISSSEYGYIQHSGNTYSWVVICDSPTTFSVKENNYEVSVNGVTYGIRAQVNQTHTGRSADQKLRDWDSDITIYTTAQPSDETLSTIETTNFYNTYLPLGVFVIDKQDDDGTPMPGVRFTVYDSDGRKLKLYQPEGAAASDSLYNVLYENGDSTNYAETGANGSLYLKLPHADGSEVSYLVEESIPQGYAGAGSSNTFLVTVNSDGRFSVRPGTLQEGSSVSPLTSAGNVYGAQLINSSNRADLVIAKRWTYGVTAEDSVTIVLHRKVNGREVGAESFVLNQENGWKVTLSGYPLMTGNRRIVYSVEETKIGDVAQGSAAWAYWIPQIQPTVYKAGGTVIQTGERESAVVYRADEIAFTVVNDRQSNSDVTLNLSKVDAADHNKSLGGVEFWIYKALDDQASEDYDATVSFGGETIKTGSPNTRTTTASGLARLKLHYSSTYYISEYATIEGYELPDGMIRVHIDTEGTITVDAEGDLAELTSAEEQSGTRVRLTVGNRSIAVPAPTGIRTDTSPYWGMLVFGVIALAAAAIPVIARKRRNWDE